MVTISDLNTILNCTSDPLILINGTGSILFYNKAADRIWKISSLQTQTLDHLVSAKDALRILKIQYQDTFDISPIASLLADTPMACCILEVGSGCPDDRKLLISLQPYTTKSTQVEEQEEFLASVAHDLKNPLGAIFGYADALIDTNLGEGLSEKQREVITRIRSTSIRTLELVRNFQYLAQLQSTKVTTTTKLTDLNQAIQTIIDSTWRPSTMGSNLTVTLTSTPIMVRVERVQLERLVANLINNALKFTPSGGTVDVSSYYNEDKSCGFKVKNTGSYIPPEERKSIFERYTRGSSGKNVPGSGLGLFIVKTILDRADGSIDVQSSQTDGTTFIVKLPNTIKT